LVPSGWNRLNSVSSCTGAGGPEVLESKISMKPLNKLTAEATMLFGDEHIQEFFLETIGLVTYRFDRSFPYIGPSIHIKLTGDKSQPPLQGFFAFRTWIILSRRPLCTDLYEKSVHAWAPPSSLMRTVPLWGSRWLPAMTKQFDPRLST
jgi:hypothetical protein